MSLVTTISTTLDGFFGSFFYFSSRLVLVRSFVRLLFSTVAHTLRVSREGIFFFSLRARLSICWVVHLSLTHTLSLLPPLPPFAWLLVSYLLCRSVAPFQCIGEKNIRFFYLFLGCLSLHVFVVGALALMPSVKQAL